MFLLTKNVAQMNKLWKRTRPAKQIFEIHYSTQSPKET